MAAAVGITVVAPECRFQPRVPSSSFLEAVERFSAVYGPNAKSRTPASPSFFGHMNPAAALQMIC